MRYTRSGPFDGGAARGGPKRGRTSDLVERRSPGRRMGRLATRLGRASAGEQLLDRERAVAQELQSRLLELLVGQLASCPGCEQRLRPARVEPPPPAPTRSLRAGALRRDGRPPFGIQHTAAAIGAPAARKRALKLPARCWPMNGAAALSIQAVRDGSVPGAFGEESEGDPAGLRPRGVWGRALCSAPDSLTRGSRRPGGFIPPLLPLREGVAIAAAGLRGA
jgi:hypothetical protein